MEKVKQYLPVGKVSMLHMKDQHFLYRIRSYSKSECSKNDIFHVPFEKRKLLSSQRYSVPGFPCLYLSNSIYVCWKELDKPNLDDLIVSKFKINDKKLRLMDLAYPTNLFLKLTKFDLGNSKISDHEIQKSIFEFLIKWPIVLCSSIQVKNKSAKFKPEYIVPQMIMEWIRDTENIDGIIYFSNKIKFENDKTLGFYCNYAFPVKTSKREGICPALADSMKLTNPISIRDSRYFNVADGVKNKYTPNINFVRLDKETVKKYSETEFGRIEKILNLREVEKIN